MRLLGLIGMYDSISSPYLLIVSTENPICGEYVLIMDMFKLVSHLKSNFHYPPIYSIDSFDAGDDGSGDYNRHPCSLVA